MALIEYFFAGAGARGGNNVGNSVSGAGGGAGKLKTGTVDIGVGVYPIVIPPVTTTGMRGGDATAFGITSTGGGISGIPGGTGGHGGGGRGANGSGTVAGGLSTDGGFPGGAGVRSGSPASRSGGGGGGEGGAGGDAGTSTPGSPGLGIQSDFTGTLLTYCEGGQGSSNGVEPRFAIAPNPGSGGDGQGRNATNPPGTGSGGFCYVRYVTGSVVATGGVVTTFTQSSVNYTLHSFTSDSDFTIVSVGGSSGEDVPVGLSTETDIALPLSAILSAVVAVGLSTESDTSLTLSAESGSTFSIGTAQELDLSLALAGIVNTVLSAGLSQETDEAFALSSASPTSLGVGLSEEIDTAFDRSSLVNTILPVSLAEETDQAFSLSAVFGISILIEPVEETDESLQRGGSFLINVGRSDESDTALARPEQGSILVDVFNSQGGILGAVESDVTTVISQSAVLTAVAFPAEFTQGSQSYVSSAVTPRVLASASLGFLMVAAVGRVSDPNIRAWTFTLDGHDFYVLRLGNIETLVYDTYSQEWYVWGTESSNLWRAYFGTNWLGGNSLGPVFGSNVIVGDDGNGALYVLDPDGDVDEAAVEGLPDQPFLRQVQAEFSFNSGYDVVPCFGVQLLGSIGQNTTGDVLLEVSDNRGIGYSSAGNVSIVGDDYLQRVNWQSLGSVRAPGRLFRFSDFGALKRIDSLELSLGD